MDGVNVDLRIEEGKRWQSQPKSSFIEGEISYMANIFYEITFCGYSLNNYIPWVQFSLLSDFKFV